MTIRDIAQKADVSRSTVSLVLNNSPLVKEKTRQKVQEIIRQTGYIPNSNARSLSNKVQYSLGIIVMVEDIPYQSYEFNYETGVFSHDVTIGISNFLAASEYNVVIERFSHPVARNDLPKLIKTRRVDGAFVVGGLYDASFIDQMLTCNIPFVVVGGHKETRVDSVSPDPGKGVTLAVDRLIETGHKSICLVNAPIIYRSSYQRQAAFEDAKKANESYIKWNTVHCPHNTGEGGYIAIRNLYESGVTPDGVIAANTTMALGVLRYLYEQKISVPDGVSIIAYEDSIMSGYSYPAMSAINIRKEYMGEVAAQLLLERMKNPDKDITTMVVEPYFVGRDSVKDRRNI